MALFAETESLKKAVHLINQLDDSRFQQVLERILSKIHLEERPFSAEEEEKLVGVLSVSASDLGLLLDTCDFLFQQAAYNTVKPTALQEQLGNIALSETKAQLISKAWGSAAKSVVEKLRLKIKAPRQLDDVAWDLRLTVSQASRSRMRRPNALFHLSLTNDEKNGPETLHLEFNHQELYGFYNQLEEVQQQLDSLS